jgi:hypothetical protein
MTVGGSDPSNAVRVFVTYEALWQIDPLQARDVHAALDLFKNNRERVEAAASRRFDADGTDDESKHEGRPTVTIRSNDL